MSQEAFADMLGVHRTYIGAIERGDKNLSLKSVERLALRLGISALDLLQPAAPVTDPAPPAAKRAGRRRKPFSGRG